MQTMYQAVPNSPETFIKSDITAIETFIALNDASVLPPGPNLATLYSDDYAETIRYESIYGNVLASVTRGFEGTARSWPAGSKIARYYTAYEHNAVKSNVEELSTKMQTIENAQKTYVHYQIEAVPTWIIDHNLNKYPKVTIVDSSGAEVVGNITHGLNTTIVTFTSAFSGKAYLN